MNFANLVMARKVLDPQWKQSLLRGRCWGPKKANSNPFCSSNITIALAPDELVSVTLNQDGSLRVHEFVRAERTSSGEEVKKVLRQAGLTVRENGYPSG